MFFQEILEKMEKTNWGQNTNRKRVLAEKLGASAFIVLMESIITTFLKDE